VVVNDAPLAEAIGRLRGEWTALTGGTITASAVTWADVTSADSLDADLVVFPSRYLGGLCSRGLLRPVRTNVLESDDLRIDDVFPLLRQSIMKWGGHVMALPLGVQLIWGDVHLDENPGMLLLVRAAPRVVSKERLGVLFDTETMKPRIAEPEFVAAMAELAESQTSGRGSQPRAGVARQEKEHEVPVVGYGDRLVAVSASSRNAASAFKLLEWLTRADVSRQLEPAGLGMLPARKSLATSPKWYPPEMSPEDRARLAEKLVARMNSEVALVIPRIPAVDEYLSFLAEAVTLSMAKSASPQAALEQAARRWELITDAHGRDSQRKAYLRHLGIDEM
jgi:hypothetical protein